MSLMALKNVKNIWIIGELFDKDEWAYLGSPLEIHPSKIIFISHHKLSNKCQIKFGEMTFTYMIDLMEFNVEENTYTYKIKFQDYFDTLSFMHAWLKSLSRNDLNQVLDSKELTSFFSISELFNFYDLLTGDEKSEDWKVSVENIYRQWGGNGVEIFDHHYNFAIISNRNHIDKIADFSCFIDDDNRYHFKYWGPLTDKQKQELHFLCLLIFERLSGGKDTFRSNRFEECNMNESRRNSIIGSSLEVRRIREKVKIFKQSEKDIWIFGNRGVGKSLLSKVLEEEIGKIQNNPVRIVFDQFKQGEVLDKLEELVNHGKNGQTIIVDNFKYLNDVHESRFWKLRKRNMSNRFIIVGEGKPGIHFIGDMVELPPLKNILEDLDDIINYHLYKICSERNIAVKRLSDVFYKKMKVYKWPKNFNELLYYLNRLVDAHLEDKDIVYENENHMHQCDPFQKQMYRFIEIKKESDFPKAYWEEKILKLAS